MSSLWDAHYHGLPTLVASMVLKPSSVHIIPNTVDDCCTLHDIVAIHICVSKANLNCVHSVDGGTLRDAVKLSETSVRSI